MRGIKLVSESNQWYNFSLNYKEMTINIICNFDFAQILSKLRIKDESNSNLIQLKTFKSRKGKNEQNTI